MPEKTLASAAHPLLSEARRAVEEHRARHDGRDAALVHCPSDALTELHRRAALTADTTVLQLLPFSPEGWDPTGYHHVLWREASRGGIRVRRLYLLPHRAIGRDLIVRQRELDRDAGIDSRVLHVNALPDTEQTVIPEGLWVIDDAVAVIGPSSSHRGSESSWVVSQRPEHVSGALTTWNSFWSRSEDTLESARAVDLEEPLVLSADLIRGVADVLCTHDHVDRDSCSWYHGSWQYLRLLNMVSTPTWHSSFYLDHIRKGIEGRSSPKVLITGTADYSMFAYVDAAARLGGCAPTIQVVDLCPTPLFACSWYAKRVQRPVTTVERDILQLGEAPLDEPCDVICTDAFLTRFSTEDVTLIAQVWASNLRPGGKLVTTVRVHPRSLPGRSSEEAVRDFRERAQQRSQRWETFLDIASPDIGELADAYARRMQSTNLGDEERILESLRDAGFEITSSALAEVDGELYPTTYLRVTCQTEEKS